MSAPTLAETAQLLMAENKGLLAMDESSSTCAKRFTELKIADTVENRRAYRELIVTTPGLNEAISGAILYDETIRQKTKDGVPFVEVLRKAGILPGIKVDKGAKALALFPEEKVTEGLDGLRDRLKEYVALGARFAKWRAVITIGKAIPTPGCIGVNVQALARYAALCQEAGLVPIVEPEVLMDGDHTIEQCLAATEASLVALFSALREQRVDLSGTLLKPNMVVPGKDCPKQDPVEKVADLTIGCFLRTVPAELPGIAFLSGGQPGEVAAARLNAMNVRFGARMPWAVTYSFSRAIQYPALPIWGGKDSQVAASQKALLHRALCSHAARAGEYSPAMEQA